MRGLSSAMQAAIALGTVRPAIFVKCDFYSGAIYVWTGNKPITWNSQTWTGLGAFMSFDKIAEDAQVAARGLKMSLNGVPSSIIATAMLDIYRARLAQIWLGFFDINGTLIVDPIMIFAGRMDVMTIRDAGDTCAIEMSVESRLIDLQRQRERRFTDADQQYFYPGDTGLKYVAGLQDQTIYWGQATPFGGGLPAMSGTPTENADRG